MLKILSFFVACLCSVGVACAQTGLLDSTYSVNGISMLDQVPGGAVTSIILNDGRTVTAGVGLYHSARAYMLAAFKTTGDIDSSFGVNGFVYDSIPNSVDVNLYNATLQPDGKILLVGTHDSASGELTGLMARFLPTGVIDSSFGMYGNATVVSPGGVHPLITYAVRVQADGRILCTGGYQGGFLLARFTSDGVLDTTFASGGIAQQSVLGAGTYEGAKDLVIQPDGKIVLAGGQYISGDYYVAVARYNPDGTLDSTFGVNGVSTTSVIGHYDVAKSVLLQEDGKIVVAGTTTITSGGISVDNAFMALRFTTTGALDNSFGIDGKEVCNYDALNDECGNAILQSDGKIVLGGYFTTSTFNVNDGLVRLTTDGQLDNTFGIDGYVAVDIPATTGTRLDYGNHVNVQTDGKLVLTGYSRLSSGFNIVAMRFLSGLELSTADMHTGDAEAVVYPNPLSETSTLSFNAINATVLTATLYDMAGNTVATLLSNESCHADQNKFALRVPENLPNANYIIRINIADGSCATIKVVK